MSLLTLTITVIFMLAEQALAVHMWQNNVIFLCAQVGRLVIIINIFWGFLQAVTNCMSICSCSYNHIMSELSLVLFQNLEGQWMCLPLPTSLMEEEMSWWQQVLT